MDTSVQAWEKVMDYAHDVGVYMGAIKAWQRQGIITQEQIDKVNELIKMETNEIKTK